MSVHPLFPTVLIAGSSIAAQCERSPFPAAPSAEAHLAPQGDASSESAPQKSAWADLSANDPATSSVPPEASDASSVGAGRCRDFKTVWVDLGGSGGQPPDRVTWRRCDGRDQSYPTDRLLLTMHGANPTELYTNAGDEVSGGLRSIEAVRLTDAGNQLLWVEQMYGTGNIYEWKVADWRGGKLRIWSEPDDVPTRERLKRKKSEEITHQEGQGPVVRGRKVVLGYVIHGGDDCHACSTGGYAKVELVARDGAFDIVRAWQEP